MKFNINSYDAVIYVDKTGKDDISTNDGSKSKPFLSILYAIEQITVTNTVIMIGKGIYEMLEAPQLSKSGYKVAFCGKSLDTIIEITQSHSSISFSGESDLFNFVIRPKVGATVECVSYSLDNFNVTWNNVVFTHSEDNKSPTIVMVSHTGSGMSQSNKTYNNCTFDCGTTVSYVCQSYGIAKFNNCISDKLYYAVNGYDYLYSSSLSEIEIYDNYKTQDEYNKSYGVYSGENSWSINPILIKEGEKYYSIKPEKYVDGEYIELTDDELLNNFEDLCFTIDELFTEITIGEETFKPINKFSRIKFISKTSFKKINLNALKSQKELIVASSDFYTTIQSNIDYFDIVGNIDSSASIKIVFSIDGGTIWKTYDTEFKDLEITIPNKQYSELTEEELIQWNNARDTIYDQGINADNLKNIDFNTLDMEKIRFAYVLSINSVDDVCNTSQLKWQFDAKGTMKSMSSDELEIELLQDSIKVTPKVDSEMIKINFTNGSTVEMAEIKDLLNSQMNDLFGNKYMETNKYASDVNDGNVRKADIAKIIEGEENLSPGLYRRTDAFGNIGYFPLEIIGSENIDIQQYILTNAKSGETQTFECKDGTSPDICLYTQAVKRIEGMQNVNGVIVDFATNYSMFNYSKNVEVNEGVCIKTKYDIPVAKNGTFYETDEIDKTDYLIINSMEVK